MAYFPESTLIDTIDGLQCKSYAHEHPEGYIIVKPKYVPKDILQGEGLKYRFLFEKCLVRFNFFAKKEILKQYVAQFRKKLPEYIYESPSHGTWFFVVPKHKIKTIHDGKKGLQELLKVPEKDLDSYLTLVRELVSFLTKSGVSTKHLGITHSTLLGNYTPGTSDIDILIYGKKNGWKILCYLQTAKHALLKWKTEEEWKTYYQEHKTSESSHFTEQEYVRHMIRKRYEGFFGGTVFTLFIIEEPEETWIPWEEETYERIGLVTIEGRVTHHENSHVRPGGYEIKDAKILEKEKQITIDPSLSITRVVSYSLPFLHQARTGETITACGLLEKVTSKKRKPYYRVVLGYVDAYLSERREKEYLKSRW
ncbi:hypothetical protein J4410_04280 [Candidatus Woesearchaeota archaeon]|nr:hypothetical protein [Candidatus Woesearchaeota archaeon]